MRQPCYLYPVSDSLEHWFAREILPYEAALMRYLTHRKTRYGDAEDLRHDIYVRVLEAAVGTRPAVPKAFLFITARNLLIDRARRDRIVPFERLLDFESGNVLVNEISAERQVSGWQQLQRLSKLFDRLPPRCREVFWKRRIEGKSARAVAGELGIVETTVERHLYDAFRRLANGMFGREAQQEGDADEHTVNIEPHHSE
jgi:RNA polymerase sigma factor (sigma-70 family)